MQKKPLKTSISLSVSPEEASYILDVVQADKIRIESLKSNAKVQKIIAEPLKVVESLEKKLKSMEQPVNAFTM